MNEGHDRNDLHTKDKFDHQNGLCYCANTCFISEEWTITLQWTKWLVSMCPLLRGSTIAKLKKHSLYSTPQMIQVTISLSKEPITRQHDNVSITYNNSFQKDRPTAASPVKLCMRWEYLYAMWYLHGQWLYSTWGTTMQTEYNRIYYWSTHFS